MLLEMFLFFDILSLNVVIKKVVTQPSACIDLLFFSTKQYIQAKDFGWDLR